MKKQELSTIKGLTEEDIRIFEDNLVDKVFLNKSYFNSFIYKKTKRAALAIFILTEKRSTESTLRKKIRESSTSFLNEVLAITLDGKLSKNFEKAISNLLEVISFLEMLYISKEISKSNFILMKDVFEDLGGLIRSKEDELIENVKIEKDFFKFFEGEDDLKDNSKGQKDIKMADKMSFRKGIKDTKGHIKDTIKKTEKSERKEVVKEDPKKRESSARRGLIMDFLKKQGESDIKDISNVAFDCSRKTLQRELSSMVDEGLIKKEGEKRWSFYSLN